MMRDEIEHVLHEAGKKLVSGKELPHPYKCRRSYCFHHVRVPRSGGVRPDPDYWAEWLARWLAVCLSAQDELCGEILLVRKRLLSFFDSKIFRRNQTLGQTHRLPC